MGFWRALGLLACFGRYRGQAGCGEFGPPESDPWCVSLVMGCGVIGRVGVLWGHMRAQAGYRVEDLPGDMGCCEAGGTLVGSGWIWDGSGAARTRGTRRGQARCEVF